MLFKKATFGYLFLLKTLLNFFFCRGEKAFCSLSCRSLEILIDEELEKSNDKTSENPLNPDDYDGKELLKLAS